MNALRIAVCEDEEKDSKHLASLINESSVSAEVSFFESGSAFLSARPAGRFDLVFFDIYMGDVSGTEAARLLREEDETCGVVFTTSSRDHMPEAFEVGAEHYLIKPVEFDKLEKVLKKRLALKERTQKTCAVNAKDNHVDVPHDQIIFVEVSGHNCLVHTSGGVIETGGRMTMEDFERQLPRPRFLRCHKSYLVNMSYVEKIDRDFIMKNGHRVYIRRDDVAKCSREFDKWRLFETGRDEI